MDRGRIPHAFIGFDEDTNDEPFFPDDFDGHFEDDIMEHFEEPPEFPTNAPIQEKYEYQSIAPFKRPPHSAANRNDVRNTKRVEMKSTTLAKTFDDSHQDRIQGIGSSRQIESEKRRNVPLGMKRTEMSYDTNPRQARGFQLEREVNSKVQSIHTVSYKHAEMQNTTFKKRARNRSPCDSFMESRPAKMPSLSKGTKKNPQEKDEYLSASRQPQYGTRSAANPNKQSTKEDEHLASKSKQPEKRVSPTPSDEIIKLREALEISKANSKRLENESAKNEHQLAQIIQTREDLQKQIIDLDKEKNACTTEVHQHYCTARKVLKIQNQFHENVELIAVYLNNKNKIKETVASVTSTCSLTKFRETLNLYRKSRDEMAITKQSCHELHKKLNKSVVETSVDDVMESNLNQLGLDVHKNLVLCRERRIYYEMMIETTQEDLMRMNAETDRLKAITNAHHDRAKEKLIDFFKLAKSQIELARQQKNLLKDQALKKVAQQKEIINSLTNQTRDILAKIELSRAKNRDLERDLNAAKSKLEKVKEEHRSVNSEFDRLEKLDTSRCLANSKTHQIMLQIKMKFEKLRELKIEKEQYETKKLILKEKLERARDVEKIKREEAELQDKLAKITQIKETTVELISVAKKTRQEKELRIRVAKEEAEALAKRRHKLLERFNARNDSMMREMKTQLDMLSTFSRIKGEEEIRRDAKQRELSSKENQILGKLFKIADLELETEQICKENQRIDELCREQKKKLVGVKCEKERAESEIRMVKKFVRDRLYTTVQEVNKTIKDIEKRAEKEELALKAVEEELTEKKLKLAELRKSKNLSLMKKEKLEDAENV